MKSQRSNLNPDTGFSQLDLSAYSPRPARFESIPGYRVITLGFTGRHVPSRLVAITLAQCLRTETGHEVLLVEFLAGAGDSSDRRDSGKDQFENGPRDDCLNLDHSLRQIEPGYSRLTLSAHTPDVLAAQFPAALAKVRHRFHHILILASSDLPASLMLDCLAAADRVFLFTEDNSEDMYQRELLIRALAQPAIRPSPAIKTIVCTNPGMPGTTRVETRCAERSIDTFLHDCPAPPPLPAHDASLPKAFLADIRRLAREIGQCRIGLALSSGGARGLAHIGIIQVLEENGIEVDVIAGCSIGAYVGAVWAGGFDGLTMEKLARQIECRWGLLKLIDPLLMPRTGFIHGFKIKERLMETIGDADFNQLVRPLHIVATNLKTLDCKVFSSGHVAQAVLASAAIPGVISPVEVDGELYMDGGIADPLPVDVLRARGIERVIAVNTIPTPEFLRNLEERQRLRHQSPTRHRRRRCFLLSLNKYLNYFAPGNILDTMMRTFNGAQMRVAEQSCHQADIVLRPLGFESSWHDFKHPGKYIGLGRRVAEEHLSQIKTLVQNKDSGDSLRNAHESLVPII